MAPGNVGASGDAERLAAGAAVAAFNGNKQSGAGTRRPGQLPRPGRALAGARSASGDTRGLLAERLTAQLLAGPPARDPVAVAERLLAIQAQDPRGARLAIRARTSGLTAADVDRALTIDRSLVVTWLNRGTLHPVRREDYSWLHALTPPPLFTGNARRLAQERV